MCSSDVSQDAEFVFRGRAQECLDAYFSGLPFVSSLNILHRTPLSFQATRSAGSERWVGCSVKNFVRKPNCQTYTMPGGHRAYCRGASHLCDGTHR